MSRRHDMLTFSISAWNDIETAPKNRVDDLPQMIMLRGRYDSGRETWPYPCWWDDYNNKWGGWPYVAVSPSHWMDMVPLPPPVVPIVEAAEEDLAEQQP